jgi:tRNA 2-thiocytidine biosynthesis protein TtcA
VPSHLMDGTRHDFKGLKVTGVPDEAGDKAFDTENFAAPAGLPALQVVRFDD